MKQETREMLQTIRGVLDAPIEDRLKLTSLALFIDAVLEEDPDQ